MNRSTIIILVILGVILLSIGFIIWFFAYSSIKNVSEDERFKGYLNKGFVVKQPYALKKNTESVNRFNEYYIDVSSEEAFENDISILKKYKVGDSIRFTSAKMFFSNHVGESYYLFGNEKLGSGEIIEFEYGMNFKYLPAIWETKDEFLERRKLNKDLPQ